MPTEYEYGHRLYVIRDVLTSDRRFAGFCQYKTQRADGLVVWKPCREGVNFSEIEPLRHLDG
jgi:hypothetical protein